MVGWLVVAWLLVGWYWLVVGWWYPGQSHLTGWISLEKLILGNLVWYTDAGFGNNSHFSLIYYRLGQASSRRESQSRSQGKNDRQPEGSRQLFGEDIWDTAAATGLANSHEALTINGPQLDAYPPFAESLRPKARPAQNGPSGRWMTLPMARS